MELKGKAKEDFEAWYPNWVKEQRLDYLKYPDEVVLRKFYRAVGAMQWGVYVDFFEEHSDGVNHALKLFRLYYVEMNRGYYEAMEASIEKTVLIYNLPANG